VADAFTLYARRGTIDSLRGLIRLYSGATAHIREPARDAGLWALDGEQSILGFTTMLAPAEPQGAVVGTTATLDASHLIRDEDYGAPLFEDLAHRFCVQVYAADLPDPNALDQVQAVIDREKPAHTDYHLCLIEARMRVGFQARLGVDTIVGGTAADLVFDETVSLGFGTILPADGAAQSRLGQQARLGGRTTLT
jgi:hypothetical protein